MMMAPYQQVAAGPPAARAPADLETPALPEALLRPEAFSHAAHKLRLHETHLSWVILAGAYAYKIKKPVNLGFADFSTLARRRTACAAEVRLNQRLCPDVYLGLATIVIRAGAMVVVDGEWPGEPVVKMRRLPAAGMLPALLERGLADAHLFQRIACQLATFHGRAATGPGVDEWGESAAVRANWVENFSQTASLPEAILPARHRATIATFVERFLATEGALLARRVATGRIRDGHGDLHAANICVEGRRLRLFDCLDFSARYRCGDVAAEVAFLAMDLAHAGRADLGLAFADRYIRATGDEEIRRLLDFYECYRAYVRGKVVGMQAAMPALPPAEAARLAAEARAYFDLAWVYAGALARRTLVVVMGLPASGKTSLARTVAGRLGLIHLSSDVVRKELAGRRRTEHRGEDFGAGMYSMAMTRRTYTLLRRRAARWLRRGQPVVLDATYGSPVERMLLRQLAAQTGARLVVLECQADEATLRARLAAREHDPETVSDARLPLWSALRAAYVPPRELAAVWPVDMTQPLAQATAQALAVILGAPGIQQGVTSVNRVD
jgi:aminoglycoside phosphotransferase family enzyme/predicted kinase